MSRAKFDTVIKGGTVVDGQRTPRFVSDIGILDGAIAYIGNIDDVGSAEVIDASGLIVAPGFVDLHTHYDSQIFWDPYCTMSGWHGVTSVVIGNCGFGFAPCKPENRDRLMLSMARNEAVPLGTMKAGMPWDWESFPEFLDSLERTPKGVNVLTYVPLNPMLMDVMGLEAAKTRGANEVERQRLRQLFTEALDAGACGFSAQLVREETNAQRDYDGTPMITDLMSDEDLLLFAEVLRERGEGFVQLTGRERSRIEDVARVSGRPVVWNSLAVSSDQHGLRTEGHRDVIAWLNDANGRGLRIFAQAFTGNLAVTFNMEDWNLFDSSPIWRDVTLGAREERLRKMADPEIREELRKEFDSGHGPFAGGGIESEDRPGTGIASLLITGTFTEKWDKYNGYTIAELAQELNVHPIDAFLDIVVEEDLATTFDSVPTNLDDDGLKEVVRSPLALPGISDGGAHTKFLTLGAYPTDYLTVHVRKNKTLDLEEAHWRLSAYPAYASGLKDRGVLREGYPADIIVYDFDTLDALPQEVVHDYPAGEWRRIRRAAGYRYILVNGVVTFVDGKSTGATPGRLLRHGFSRQSVTLAAAE
jgi:N-acyl-D-amino-acid deacylase